VNVNWVPAQTSSLSAIILTLTGRFGFTVMGITLLTAVAGHWRLEVSCRLTLFPLANVVVVKVGVVTPVLVPSTSQSNNGLDPPFSILDAEKVTAFPSQVGLADATIVMTGVSVGFTVIVIVLLMLVAGQVASEVTSRRITLPLVRVLLVYVSLFAPGMGAPLRVHWYVGLVPAFVTFDVNVTSFPEQIMFDGLAEMVTTGTVLAIMVTSTVADVWHPLASVIVREYVPVATGWAFIIVGLWRVDVNPFGPDQLYE
jgi:hypothetical protein